MSAVEKKEGGIIVDNDLLFLNTDGTARQLAALLLGVAESMEVMEGGMLSNPILQLRLTVKRKARQ